MGLVIVTSVGWGGAGYSDICRMGWGGAGYSDICRVGWGWL